MEYSIRFSIFLHNILFFERNIFLKISAFLKIILFGGGSSIHAKVVQNLNRSYSNFSHHLGLKGTKITII
jgi:hypothetical protein